MLQQLGPSIHLYCVRAYGNTLHETHGPPISSYFPFSLLPNDCVLSIVCNIIIMLLHASVILATLTANYFIFLLALQIKIKSFDP